MVMMTLSCSPTTVLPFNVTDTTLLATTLVESVPLKIPTVLMSEPETLVFAFTKTELGMSTE